MTYRQFPVKLKKRVRAFYEYRYQQNYFKESTNLKCLSGLYIDIFILFQIFIRSLIFFCIFAPRVTCIA